MKNQYHRTKIVATVGPKSSSLEELEKLILAGVDVFRLNFSHGSHEGHLEVIRHIKNLIQKHGIPVGLLADLQGPKLRIGDLEKGEVFLLPGEQIILTTVPCMGNKERIYLNYPDFPKDARPGEVIKIDDGKIELKVIKTDGKENVTLEVLYGGKLKPRKGVNFPDTQISMPSITEKDFNDLLFSINNEVSWIALSFVRTAEEIKDLKSKIPDSDKIKIIAKIEKPEALINIDEIIKESDGIMIARGDLAIEVPLERMPLIQKEISGKCLAASKPFIIATQIMESMIENPGPSRAEIMDVANGVLDGADALMLSGETAVGNHPVKVVETITKIIREVEANHSAIYNRSHVPSPDSPTFLSDSVCYNASRIATELNATAIIGMTRSGYTAFRVSSHRPKAPVYILTDNPQLPQIVSLCWGVRAFFYNKFVSTDETINDSVEILREKGFVNKGDVVVNLASMPIYKKSRTNMLKVTRVEG